METTTFKLSRRVREATFTVVFGDTTSALAVTLPEGARIIDWIVNVKTAFAGGTTELNVGISGTATYFISALSVASIGRAALTTELLLPAHETTDQLGIYASVGAGNTAGEADVTVLFALDTDRRF